MRRPAFPRQLAGLGALALVAASCRNAPAEPRELGGAQVVLRLPDDSPFSMASAPDGTLFLTTFRGALYRSRDAGRAWERVAQQTQDDPALLYLYAPSRATAFAAQSDGPEVYRWDEGSGLRRQATPVSGRWAACGDYTTFARLKAIWGRGEREVYAVGDCGLVLRYDGRRWAVEPNPMSDSAGPDLCRAAYRTTLHAVGGDARHVYAAGRRAMRRARDGAWEVLPGVEGPGEAGSVDAITTGRAGLVFAGVFEQPEVGLAPDPLRFFRPVPRTAADASGWEYLWRGGPYIEFFSVGASPAGGPAVFYDIRYRTVLLLDGKRLRRYRVPGVSGLRGAAVVGGHLVAAGRRDTSAVVVRVRLP